MVKTMVKTVQMGDTPSSWFHGPQGITGGKHSYEEHQEKLAQDIWSGAQALDQLEGPLCYIPCVVNPRVEEKAPLRKTI